MGTMLTESLQSSLAMISQQTINEVSIYLPRILASFFVLLVGTFVAKAFKRVVVRILQAFKLSSLVQQTPVEHFLKNADVAIKIEEVVGKLFYWLAMLVVLNTTVAVLGLDPVSVIFEKLLSYIPHVFSAVLILFFGVLLAGFVESLTKGAIKSIDGRASRLLGKVSSYMVVTVSILAAISELGIASEFIMVLFIGFILMISLGVGLALGLGGQDVVRKILNSWYEQTTKELDEK